MRLRLEAARHELRCRECRVTWRSWLGRIVGIQSAYSPRLKQRAGDPT